MTMSAGEVSCHGMAITVMTLSILEALAAALEPRPDVPRERAPAISVVPTAASQPRLPEATSSPGAQRVRESETLTAATPPGQEEWTIDGGWMLLEQRVEHLVPAFLGGDPSYLFTFLSTYRAFATSQQVLEILFMRYGCFHSEAEEDGGPREQEKLAISSILGTWMDHYPEEFFRPPDFTSLKLLRAYVRVHMPGSELQRRARLLYSWRKHPLAAALEPRPDVPRERAPAISVVPTAASQPRLPEATSSPGAQRVRESETLTAATPPGQEEWTIDGGWMLLEQRVEHLVPAFLGGDPSYLFTFLSTYRAFATSQQVLEILFMRYGCFHSEAEEDGGPREQEKLAISSILGTWMDHYPEEFFRPPDFTSLKLLRAYVRVHMPGSELQRRARLLYSWRKHPLAAALEPRPDVPRERAPAISVVPTAASQPRLPEATSSPGAQRVRESETLTAATPPGQEEWTIDGGWMLLEQRVEHLVPAFLGGDPSYLFTFLSTYRAFATSQQVLEILFMRYGCFHSEAEEDGGPREQEKLAISSILGTWMDHYPEEFFRPPDFTSLKLLRAYVRVHMPGSELQRRARLLYSWRKHPLAAALEPRPDVPRERAPAISVVPTAASQPRLPEATSSPGAQRVRESETLTAATPPGQEEWTIDGGWMLLEQRVEHLVPAFLGGDPSYLFTFLSTYRAFATTQQVLEILFMRAISSILGTWMDHYPEEFFRPPDFTSLKLLRAYVRVHMPGSELQRRARLLYSWRKHPLAAALEPRPDVPRERAPAISVVPTAASQPRLPEATSSPGAQRVRESETLTAATPPGQEVLPALADSQELEEPPAPLVAPEHEQPPAPAGGVTEGLEQPPAAAEQPASAPQQRLMSAAAPQDEFPHLDIAFFVMLGLGIDIFSVLMYYWLTLNT
ncbi:uncharacterized protein LOC123383565 isoform X5 [Felis catus]|uniref:uncharacterized protein LOC123383565 isoform X5 n=1 Tax=Felis catus TaxID=9685 RepID=UPI001D19CEE8|nr:uncharacterized protein LOC123383565 isoform X5 [Felis catus]